MTPLPSSAQCPSKASAEKHEPRPESFAKYPPSYFNAIHGLRDKLDRGRAE